ncbi:MAG: hypothetical protein KDA79_04885 [Planctomycetaceae bacterium]|nr:hypothetical protein [Planctomycetaceae bacterium]
MSECYNQRAGQTTHLIAALPRLLPDLCCARPEESSRRIANCETGMVS